MVDDGSTDDTAAVAERWSEVAPVRVVRSTTRGPQRPRHAGVAATTAPLLAFVDADDVWLADHLDVAVSARRPAGSSRPNTFSWRPGSALPSATRRQRFPIPAPHRQRTGIVRENFVFSSVVVSRRDYEAAGRFRDGVTAPRTGTCGSGWSVGARSFAGATDRRGCTTSAGSASPTDPTCERRTRRYSAGSSPTATMRGSGGQPRNTSAHCSPGATRPRLRRERSGDPGVARRLARSTLHGRPRVAAEALSVAVAPGLATRLGDEARARWTAGRR